jgi:hypothetical protein
VNMDSQQAISSSGSCSLIHSCGAASLPWQQPHQSSLQGRRQLPNHPSMLCYTLPTCSLNHSDVSCAPESPAAPLQVASANTLQPRGTRLRGRGAIATSVPATRRTKSPGAAVVTLKNSGICGLTQKGKGHPFAAIPTCSKARQGKTSGLKK